MDVELNHEFFHNDNDHDVQRLYNMTIRWDHMISYVTTHNWSLRKDDLLIYTAIVETIIKCCTIISQPNSFSYEVHKDAYFSYDLCHYYCNS